MKNFIAVLLLISSNAFSQSELKFDKISVECEDKWVAFHDEKNDNYNFGFIYIDNTAGLTLNYEGIFKIDDSGKFILQEFKEPKKTDQIKIRLKPNKMPVAEIPESKFQELGLVKTPEWLKYYKEGENTASYLYNKGFLLNEYNQLERALICLEKADKIDSNYKGLQTELAFTYNALKRYDKAEVALKKALKENPKDCYTMKELAYTYCNSDNLKQSGDIYQKMKSCEEKLFIEETAYNIAHKYYEKKDKINFEKWSAESKKWATKDSRYSNNLDIMKTELDK
jgi:tetratricopeptide (TPR) repeat protein